MESIFKLEIFLKLFILAHCIIMSWIEDVKYLLLWMSLFKVI